MDTRQLIRGAKTSLGNPPGCPLGMLILLGEVISDAIAHRKPILQSCHLVLKALTEKSVFCQQEVVDLFLVQDFFFFSM